MEDILKLLVESRQPAKQQTSQSDPMTDLIGSLLGGGQAQSSGNQANPMADMLGSLLGGGQQQSGGSQQTGLGNIMGLLEMVTGSGQQSLGQSSLTQ